MNKFLSEEENIKNEKRHKRSATIIGISIVVVLVPIVWFLTQAAAVESVIDTKSILINDKNLTVVFSEKTSDANNRTYNAEDSQLQNFDVKHYGYILELYDSTEKKSLDKIEFDSPEFDIQSTPKLFVLESGTIWLVSTSIYTDDDKRGFILKFSINNSKIIEQDFSLDEKYRIRNIEENKVVISEGTSFDGGYLNPIFGGIYFDLETEKIVDDRRDGN